MDDLTQYVKGETLRRVVELWPIVKNILGVDGFKAITFVERGITSLQPTPYACSEELGLWAETNGLDDCLIETMVQAGYSDIAQEFAASGTLPNNDGGIWWRITAVDFEKVIALARSVVSNKPNAVPCSGYPLELQVAIEAFEAVFNNESALRGKSPKGALLAWLAKNKPDLGTEARDRIATLCNWQKQGGATKIPG